MLQYAIQITDALDTAHRHGVIHRDLKPGNIMLTKTGAKLLDFGLAKVRAAEAVAGMTALPTQTTPLTGEGTILGTLQYMAPEQLEGDEADARTDIFALGAVIYEMATGRKAFEGKSQASLISAIMTAEPPAISTLQAMAPPALDHVVRTCLAKDPEARWQTAHDVLVELKWIAEAGSQAGVPGPVAARRKNRERLSWALAAVASFALLVLAVVHIRGRPPDVHRARFLVPIPEKLNLEWYDGPAVSPDGQKFVFGARGANGKRLLWIRSLDALAAEPLAGTEGAFCPFWSPDSRFFAFLTPSDNKLKKMEASPGALVQTICEAPEGTPGSWSRDGVILFTGPTGLRRVSAAGGEVRAALDLARQESVQAYPYFLPDGRNFLFFSRRAGPGESGTYLGTLGSKETRLLISTESNAYFALPGFLIYGRGETVMAQPFSASKLRFTGEPFVIAQHVRRLSQFPASLFGVSDTGILVYRNAGSSNVQLAWYGRDGKRLQPVGEPGEYREMALSPDGTRLALERADPRTGAQNIWILELATSILWRLTFASTNDSDLVWSPDGREVVFTKDGDLSRKTVGGGDEELLYQSGEAKYAYHWLKSGKAILFMVDNGKTFYQLPLTGEQKPMALVKSQYAKDGLSVSSDERWATYSSFESGRWEVYLAAFPTFTEKRQISNNGGCQPVWRKDGKELFYLALDGKLMVAEIKSGTTLTAGVPRVLFQSSLQVYPNIHQYNVTADGRKFIFGEPINEGAEQFTAVLNWAAGLQR